MIRVKSRQNLLFISTVIFVLIIDQVTKSLVRANMTLGQSIPPAGKFRLSFSTNSGAVFGLQLDSTFLTILSCIAVIVIFWVYFRYLSARSKLLRVGLGLVLGGTGGNLIDRFRFGEVTDFIDVHLWGDYHWPTFNVADASLTTGIFIVIFSLLIISKPQLPWEKGADYDGSR